MADRVLASTPHLLATGRRPAKTPRRAAAAVSRDPRFTAGLRALALRQGRPGREVRREAETALAKMAAGESRLALSLWRRLERLAAHAYRLDVDDTGARRLRAMAGDPNLVFLPSHRSYLDPLILREALRRHGFPPNHVLGGVNVAFWPLGPIGRRAGYVFIRRSVRDDPVYRFVLAEYIHHLARRGSNLEWYLEGGRTRTGRLRAPRLGLLAYLLRAQRAGDTRETYIVPTSIVYDTLYELGALEAEEHGAAKQPEGLSWALRYARAQRRGFGRAYLRFGTPIALSEWAAEAPVPPGGENATLEKLACEVCHRIDGATPVTGTALVCLAFVGGDHRMSAEAVRDALRPFLAYLAARGQPVAGGADLVTAEGVGAILAVLTARGVLRRWDGPPRATWSMARPFAAAFYRNGAAPHFVNRALAELVATWAATEHRPDPITSAWTEALRLRRLLEFEFVFGSKHQFAADLHAELVRFVPDWEQHAGETAAVWSGLAASRLYVAPRLLQGTFEAYQVVADELVARQGNPVGSSDELLAACLHAARRASLRHLITSGEADAAEPLRNGIRLAQHRGLLTGCAPALDESRRAFAAEIAGVVARLDHLALLASDAGEAVPAGQGVP